VSDRWDRAAVAVVEVLERAAGRGQGLMSVQQLRAAGIGSCDLTRAVRRGEVVRVRRGVYALTALPPWPRHVVTDTGPQPEHVVHVRAVLLSLGSAATATGRTAAALRGWGLLVEPSRTVEVALPHAHGHTAAPRVQVRRRRRVARERWRVLAGTDALWLTTAEQTVVDLALALPLLEAVVACDSALRAGHVTLTALRAHVGRLQGRRDAARLRQVLDLADPESGSVLESVLRVRMVQDGIDGFLTQVDLRDADGNHVLRADFCFPGARLVVEVDGARWHPDGHRDRRRDNELACLGWRVLRFTWSDVVHDTAAVLRQVRAAAAPDRTQNSGSDRAAA